MVSVAAANSASAASEFRLSFVRHAPRVVALLETHGERRVAIFECRLSLLASPRADAAAAASARSSAAIAFSSFAPRSSATVLA